MLSLPRPTGDYFSLSADASVAELGQVLAEGAVIRDERRVHHGLEAIREWRVDTMARTPFEVRPLSVETHGEEVTVKAEVSGAFPGSPVVLAHRFIVRDDRIVSLEII